jgi:hypothetical protein
MPYESIMIKCYKHFTLQSWINLSDPIPQATALVQETKSYPTSTRRRAKKIRAETAKSQAAAEPEAEETAQDMDISNEHAQPNQKKKGTGKKGKVFATQVTPRDPDHDHPNENDRMYDKGKFANHWIFGG